MRLRAYLVDLGHADWRPSCLRDGCEHRFWCLLSEVVIPLPPVSPEAEENILGGLMLSPKAIEIILDSDLDADAFYRASHGIIYQACLMLYAKSIDIDAITLVEELSRTNRLKDAGGEEKVYELATLGITWTNIGHYAKIVRDKWLLREAERTGKAISQSVLNGGTAEEVIGQADGLLLDLTAKLERRKESVYTGKQLVERFRTKLKSGENTDGAIETPFPSFLRPFMPGRLYVLGGYSKDGKSALALQFLRSACEAGKKVGFMSIEMNHQDLTDRLVSTFGVPLEKILDGDVAGYEDIIEKALAEIETWDFEVLDDGELNPTSIKRAQRRGKYDFLIIDHLHRIRIKDKRHAYEETTQNMVDITNLAKSAEVPILLLSQLARGQKHDPYPRPTQEAVRGTSAIENEASMVLFIWRLRDENGMRTSDAELIIAANRFGTEGSANLNFRAGQVRFELAGRQTGG